MKRGTYKRAVARLLALALVFALMTPGMTALAAAADVKDAVETAIKAFPIPTTLDVGTDSVGTLSSYTVPDQTNESNIYSVSISWFSVDTSILSDIGEVVVRPTYAQGDKNATLDARYTITNNNDPLDKITGSVSFTITVKAAAPTEADKVELVKGWLAWTKLSSEPMSEVTKDLTLPSAPSPATISGVDCSSIGITWGSSNTAISAPSAGGTATVTRPAAGAANATGNLTATIGSGGKSDTLIFNITVLAQDVNQPIVDTLIGTLTWDTIANDNTSIAQVKTDLNLITTIGTSPNNATVSWVSSNTAVITNAGKVTPAASNTSVTLTATVSKGSASATKSFAVTVLPAKNQNEILNYVSGMQAGIYKAAIWDYNAAEPFGFRFENFAVVQKGGRETLVDHNGGFVSFDSTNSVVWFDWIDNPQPGEDFTEARYTQNGTNINCYIENHTGRIVYELPHAPVTAAGHTAMTSTPLAVTPGNSQGLYAYKDESNLWGYKDENGTTVIAPQFDAGWLSSGAAAAHPFTENYAWFLVNGKYGLLRIVNETHIAKPERFDPQPGTYQNQVQISIPAAGGDTEGFCTTNANYTPTVTFVNGAAVPGPGTSKLPSNNSILLNTPGTYTVRSILVRNGEVSNVLEGIYTITQGGHEPPAPPPDTAAESGPSELESTISGDTAHVTVSADEMEDAISQASADGTVAVNVVFPAGTNAEDIKAVHVDFPKSVFSNIAQTDTHIEINMPVASITFDNIAIDKINDAGDGAVRVSASVLDNETLPAGLRAVVGGRPVYDFSVTAGGNAVTGFGDGTVYIEIPYIQKDGENPNAIVVWYLSDDGVLHLVTGRYDSTRGVVTFETNHFSKFVIGYNMPGYTDIADSFAEDAIIYLAARNCFSYIPGERFNPSQEITRGEFTMVLMKAYGIEPADTLENFSDVDPFSAYAPYLAAAKAMGLVNGGGNNSFRPEAAMTRSDMFTLLYNVLLALGKIPEPVPGGKDLSDFSDSGDLPSWTIEAVEALAKANIIGNTADGKLNPRGKTGRQSMAQLIYNLQ